MRETVMLSGTCREWSQFVVGLLVQSRAGWVPLAVAYCISVSLATSHMAATCDRFRTRAGMVREPL